MSDLKKYISKRKINDCEFTEGFEEGYQSFKIGVFLKQARQESGLTQEQMAQKLNTKKSAISLELFSCLSKRTSKVLKPRVIK